MLSIGWAGAPDPYAFGIGISTLFSTTAQNRETMGECARRLAENEFSWNRAASRIEAFWQPLFASSGALSDD